MASKLQMQNGRYSIMTQGDMAKRGGGLSVSKGEGDL